MNPIYLFDMDGTLIDSMEHFDRGLRIMLEQAGIPYDPALIKKLVPLGYTKSAEYFVSRGVPLSVEEIVARFEALMQHAYAHDIRTKPGVPEYLRRLQENGARLFVLTASPHSLTDVCLRQNGIWPCFEQVWSVDDFGLTKSNPAIFREAARTIGCDPADICFFDDNINALKTAKLAGLRVYGVRDCQSEEDLAEIRASFDGFVADFTALNETGELLPA